MIKETKTPMTRSVAPMRAAKIGCVVLSAALCVLGLVLIIFPDFSLSLAGTLCGILVIALGSAKLIGYFSRDLYRLAFQYDLATGILLIVLGIVMLVYPGSLMNFLCITLGFVTLADGLFKIQITMDARRFGLRRWWLILACAILACLCGALLVFRPVSSARVLTILLGITLLSDGILTISTMLTAVKIIRHQQPDVIEGEFTVDE